MDGPLHARDFGDDARGRLQSCVRPFYAVLMTAGPDGIREHASYQVSLRADVPGPSDQKSRFP